MREIDIVDNERLRILFAMPETAGDIFISTGICAALKNKFPNSTIYFATKPEYYQILEGCPYIDGVIEYTEAMLNYRNFETWGNTQHLFDIVYNPNIITQKIPHWIHRGKGPYLGDAYAHMCNVAECLDPYIRVDDVSRLNLPEKFITIHSQTRQDPKNYDYMQKIIDNIKDIPIVQIGGSNDNKLNNIALDLRGQTTPQELAGVFKKAMLHIGLDSFPMHIAIAMETPVVAMFGGTYIKQGLHPRHKGKVFGLETQDRGPCVTSCHLSECLAKKIGIDKCINNIPVDDVLDVIRELIGSDHVSPPEPINISSYIIIKDGIKYGFPFERCIAAALKVSDEVVVVDGGSTDLTYEQLLGMGQPSGLAPRAPEHMKYIWKNTDRLKIFQHEWDMNNPTLFGDEKTYARKQCTGNWLIQLDADEIIQEPYPGAIRDLIKKNRSHDGMDLPCINFYGDEDTIRVEQNAWKWRITRNDSNIIHGVHAEAQQFDQDAMRISMDKTKSDSCLPPGEMIFTNNGLVPIEKIKIGDLVLGHSGKFQKVINLGKRKINEEIYEIKAKGFRLPLQLTANHKILTKRWEEDHFIRADKLNKDDNLIFTLPQSNRHGTVYCLDKYINNKYWNIDNKIIKCKNNGNKTNRHITLNNDLAWILGLYCAEGSMCNGQTRFTINIKEQDLKQKCINKFKNIFGECNVCDYSRPRVNANDFIIGNKIIGAFISDLCGVGAKNKQVPMDILLSTNKSILESFLDGYLLGDGSYYKGKDIKESPSISINLAYGIFIIYAKLNKNPNIYKQHIRATKIMPNNKEYKMSPVWKTTCIGYTRPRNRLYAVENNESYLSAKVLSIKKKPYNGYVYNIEVENDHSYMTQSFHVKNCEYIYADSMKFIKHKPAFPVDLLRTHVEFHMGKVSPEKYNKLLCDIVKNHCVAFHYSWFDLKRKENNGAFWDKTFHGKKELTHNTTKDIKERVEANKDKLIKVTFDHPMRTKDAKTTDE